MKRHPALVPLSHDHQHSLAAALRLRRAADAWRADARNDDLHEIVHSFVELARREFLAHFEEEEQALLPLMVTADSALKDGIARLSFEHAELRAGITELATLLHRCARDASAYASLAERSGSVAALLQDHVRWEERELFGDVQSLVDEADLDALALPPRHAHAMRIGDGTLALDLRTPEARVARGRGLDVRTIDLAPREAQPAPQPARESVLVAVRGDATLTLDDETERLVAPGVRVCPAESLMELRAGARGALLLYVCASPSG